MVQDTVKPAATKPDSSDLPLGTQEAQYQLATRLVDYMRLGEAIRILEALGDYKNSPALLKTAREIRDYADREDAKRREEERRSREKRDAEVREADRKWNRLMCVMVVAVVLGICLLVLRH